MQFIGPLNQPHIKVKHIIVKQLLKLYRTIIRQEEVYIFIQNEVHSMMNQIN